MNNESLVSIVLPFFNGKEFIRETLESIRRQTFKSFEVIVVDDGSTKVEHSEDLRAAIGSLSDPRFKYHHKENGGLSNARNFGIDASTGAWIAFIDQDDLWNERKLELQVAVLTQHPEVNFIFTDGKLIGDVEGELHVASKNSLREGTVKDTYTKLLKGNFVISSSILFRKSKSDQVGDSNPCFKICPDYEHVIRFAEHTDFYFIDAALVSYRIHGTNTVKNELKQSAEVLLLLCDRKIVTKTQKLLATYNLVRNILTLIISWTKKLLTR